MVSAAPLSMTNGVATDCTPRSCSRGNLGGRGGPPWGHEGAVVGGPPRASGSRRGCGPAYIFDVVDRERVAVALLMAGTTAV